MKHRTLFFILMMISLAWAVYHCGEKTPQQSQDEQTENNTDTPQNIANMSSAKPDYEIITEEDKLKIAAKDGRKWQIISQGDMLGYLDVAQKRENDVYLAGWSFDKANAKNPHRLLVFVNGQYVAKAECGKPRSDVAKSYGEASQSSGFGFTLSNDFIRKDNLKLQLYAISSDSPTAIELRYPSDYQWK